MKQVDTLFNRHTFFSLFFLFLSLAQLNGESFSATPLKNNPFLSSFNFIEKRVQSNPFHRGSRPQTTPLAPKQNRLTATLTQWQRNIQKKLKRYVTAIKDGSKKAIVLSILASFLYGILHAAGPGHRKIVFFTYFSSRKHKISTVFATGFSSAGIHALSALLLTSIIFFTVEKAASSKLGTASRITEIITWLFIAFFGLTLIVIKIIQWIRTRKDRPQKESKISKSKKALPLLVFFSSIVPCPAASMIFIVTLHQKIALIGVFLIIAMSLGMGLTVSLASLPALLASNRIRQIGKKDSQKESKIEIALEILGALVMLLLGLLMSIPLLLH